MREVEMASTSVSVTPTGINGNEVECDITGKEVIDDALFLARDKTYDIVFDLAAGATQTWDLQNPFCASNGKCPPVNAAAHGHYRVKSVSAKTLTIEAKAPNARSVIHYRLNFAGGGTFDPIIIRD
ncbi:MAG TPA: hypothetical protein VM145_00765 [Sphingomicrobium sp.]|nr:hypothetical protein [Sphingomicrobium sp.]